MLSISFDVYMCKVITQFVIYVTTASFRRLKDLFRDKHKPAQKKMSTIVRCVILKGYSYCRHLHIARERIASKNGLLIIQILRI
ncbi:hypothetical protein SAMN05444369_11212 [Capnocytophaga haemolytica]|uniref:Transposase n=1 Tax=Capnocytophaga haemolytica TaxID=45243 RepID=A0AAX2GW75_9FLAO|nr:hypothetical protein SAMN05444369_11212 [Capnocytophaga haemolytica]SNV00963.1 Uncharacterised protein [Capnocytophaga haemolytica]